MVKKTVLSAVALMALMGAPTIAAESIVKADFINGNGKPAGYAEIMPMHDGIMVHVEAEGLSPGWHGLHIHGMGDCSDHKAGFKAAGSHAAHGDEKHGFKNGDDAHFGDLPNLWATDNGVAKGEFFIEDVEMKDLQDKDGSSIMIHATADDYTSQPAGNSGDRVACGVIAAHDTAQ